MAIEWYEWGCHFWVSLKRFLIESIHSERGIFVSKKQDHQVRGSAMLFDDRV